MNTTPEIVTLWPIVHHKKKKFIPLKNNKRKRVVL